MGYERLAEFVQEPRSGKLSSTRLLKLLWGAGALAIWIMASVQMQAMAPISEGTMAMIIGIMGVGTVQRFAERGNTTTPPTNG